MPKDVGDNVRRHRFIRSGGIDCGYQHRTEVSIFRRQWSGCRQEYSIMVFGIQHFSGRRYPCVKKSGSLQRSFNAGVRLRIDAIGKIAQQPERRSSVPALDCSRN